MWKLKGRGAWEVRDYNKEIIYLFKTKKEAKEFADSRGLVFAKRG